jgi:hypothetical protein
MSIRHRWVFGLAAGAGALSIATTSSLILLAQHFVEEFSRPHGQIDAENITRTLPGSELEPLASQRRPTFHSCDSWSFFIPPGYQVRMVFRLALGQPPEKASSQQDQEWFNGRTKARSAVVYESLAQCGQDDEVDKEQLAPVPLESDNQAERCQHKDRDRKCIAHAKYDF